MGWAWHVWAFFGVAFWFWVGLFGESWLGWGSICISCLCDQWDVFVPLPFACEVLAVIVSLKALPQRFQHTTSVHLGNMLSLRVYSF